jgi:hypothetical protein
MKRLVQEERMQDQLEDEAVSDDLLSMRLRSESEVFNSSIDAEMNEAGMHESFTPLASVRIVAVRVLKELVHAPCTTLVFDSPDAATAMKLLHEFARNEVKSKLWLDSVLRLDVYCSKNQDVLRFDSIPMICAAVVMLGFKFESRSARMGPNLELLLPQRASTIMNQMLCAAGQPPLHEALNFSVSDLRETERNILASLKWRLILLPAPDWIQMFFARLDVMTCRQLSPVINCLCRHSTNWAQLVLLGRRTITTPDSAPHRIAQGLVCLVCVASGVLPASAFHLDEANQLSLSTLPMDVSMPELNAYTQAIFVAGLLEATRSSLTTLAKDLSSVLSIVGDIVASAVQLSATSA